MKTTELDGRRRNILCQVVGSYIETAEPVGSRSIAKMLQESLSPATIRNVMSDLEDMGYLEQPHPSSGRVPTDKGYRFFVDQLKLPDPVKVTPLILNPSEKPSFSKETLEEVLENACSQLSQTSHQTGLAMFPGFSRMLFKHIQFTRVGKSEALATFVSELGVLQNKIIPIDENITQDGLTSISNYLNREFSGRSIQAIRKEIITRIQSEREHYDRLMNKAMELWSKTFSEEDEDAELIVDGILNFFDHPEFAADLKKIKALLQTLEEKSKLVKLLDLCLESDGMTIIIGQEHSEEAMQGCSLIAQTYQIDSSNKGTMAVFGPKRMDYQKMIGLVNVTAKTVTEMISIKNREL